jgi:wyosine [tRNA(Phe)-imidazoG37] synthetase (radical SAM superfamily)
MTALFTQHSRSWQTNRYVYPVVSRRSRGLSVGVNLNPDKACNFDCAYCSVDRTVPSTVRDVDPAVLRAELDHLLGLAASGAIFAQPPFDATPAHLRRINDVAFSGDGEPTSYSGFTDACRLAAELIAAHGLIGVKPVLITNATLLDRPAVQSGLAVLDACGGEIWAKLDAGTEDWYQRVDRSRIPLSKVIANIRAAGQTRDLVIQSLFCRLHGEAPSDAEITAYVGHLAELRAAGCRIRLVQVYTTARTTAESYVDPLTLPELQAIVARITVLGIAAEAFG